MKKLLIILMAVTLLAALCGCAKPASQSAPTPEPPAQTAPAVVPDATPEPAPTSEPTPSPAPTPEPVRLAESELNKLGFMLSVIGDHFQDGGSEQLGEYSSKARAGDDFYSGVIFFYAFNSDQAKETLGDAAIMPEDANAYYVFTPEQLQKLFESFFGARYSSDIALTFADYRQGDGYSFMMSDGPTPYFDVHDYEVLPSGDVRAMVYVGVEGEDGRSGVGTFDASFTKDKASMFGYTLQAFTFSTGGS